MKKLCICACLLGLATGVLPAESFLLFGGSFGYTSQNTAALDPWSATSLGVFGQSYFDSNGPLGSYTAATVGLVVGSQSNGTSLDPTQYQTFSLNILSGIGYRVALGGLTAIAGAGLYIGSTSLSAVNASLSSYVAGGVGAGIGASLLYSLAYNWGIGLNVNASYYFTIPGDVVSTLSPSGFTVFGGIGMIYFYQPATDMGSAASFFSGQPAS
jgi:hypothetical protein